MNYFELINDFNHFRYQNTGVIKHLESDLYHHILFLWNKLGQKEVFGLPTAATMEALDIGSYNTFKKAFNKLVEHGFIKVVVASKNQYRSKKIALLKRRDLKSDTFDRALNYQLDNELDEAIKNNKNALSKNDKALDKAHDKTHDEATNKAHDKTHDNAIDTIGSTYIHNTDLHNTDSVCKKINKKEIEAYELLQLEMPTEIASFEVSQKNSFPENNSFSTFVHFFNSSCRAENLTTAAEMFTRLEKLNINWNKTPRPEKTKSSNNHKNHIRDYDNR